jgi:hypothetical protein
MSDQRGPYVGPQTKPRQLRPSQVTIEDIEQDEVRVQGTYDVAVPGAVWRQRPEYGEAFEREIEAAIRAVVQKYTRDCPCLCHQGVVVVHVVACCENYASVTR